LNDAAFMEAMGLLKKPAESFDRSEKLLADNLEALLRGGIGVETYNSNRRFIRGETGPVPKPDPHPEPQKKFCTRCGTPGTPGHRFCTRCGFQLG
jgi:hypothetical protein